MLIVCSRTKYVQSLPAILANAEILCSSDSPSFAYSLATITVSFETFKYEITFSSNSLLDLCSVCSSSISESTWFVGCGSGVRVFSLFVACPLLPCADQSVGSSHEHVMCTIPFSFWQKAVWVMNLASLHRTSQFVSQRPYCDAASASKLASCLFNDNPPLFSLAWPCDLVWRVSYE